MSDLFSFPPPAKRSYKRERNIVAGGAVAAFALVVLLVPAMASAHHIDIIRDCDSVTVESFSDGTMSVLGQTGDVFAVGQTAPPGNPGLLTKPALPSQSGSVTVTWTTDSSHSTVSWAAQPGCVTTTTSTTAPSTTTSLVTTTTAPSTTTSLVTTTTAPSTTTSLVTTTTAPTTTSTNPCDHKTPEGTLPPECFPSTTTSSLPPVSTVCGEGEIGTPEGCKTTTTPAPPAPAPSTPAPPVAATPAFTG